MNYTSTRSNTLIFNFSDIIQQGIPDDGGLFVPEDIPKFELSYFDDILNKDFNTIAFDVARKYIGSEIIPDPALKDIVKASFTFEIPLKEIHKDMGILELFHGPTSAFKDFGARFMANCLSYILREEHHKVTIVTATSGDTGGAVASGYHNVDGVDVFILYPKGRVSEFQEKQIAGPGDNIRAIEIDGSFDDCQELVKACFADKLFKNENKLTSSNSVNFSRLIPQIIYYFEAYKIALKNGHRNVSFIIPSGNFGNLTGGVYAKKMGLPIDKLIAATNANDVFPNYLKSGIYEPHKSKKTISNAMDVGNPSNIERIFYVYRSTWNKITKDINSHSINDVATKSVIENIYKKHNYLVDPHTAVGISNYYLETMYHSDTYYIILATAHPYKFESVMHSILPKVEIPINDEIRSYENMEVKKIEMNKDLEKLKTFIKENIK